LRRGRVKVARRGPTMSPRLWRGWTTAADADAY
jgi:hypothetical protein